MYNSQCETNNATTTFAESLSLTFSCFFAWRCAVRRPDAKLPADDDVVFSLENTEKNLIGGRMGKDDRPQRKELLPSIDPEWVKSAISRPEDEEPEVVFDPDDPDSVWILGNDPEAKFSSVADRRNLIHKQMLSTGGQFVAGLLLMFVALGITIMAITNPVKMYIIPAAIIAPISLWYMRARWQRWLGSAPYMYRLMTSLGEDAENILVNHEEKQREKFVNKVGDLYAVNTKPKKKQKQHK